MQNLAVGKTAMITTAAALGLVLSLAPAGRGLAAAAGPFDGMWNVEVDCPDVGDVRGYNWRFSAQVSGGVLAGHYQSSTNSAMGNLSGRIRPDGQALLTLVGRTGPEEMALYHKRPGTPFRYTANVHFDANSGSGTRNGPRACALSFTKA
jgi:hypothetical protein